MDKLMGSAKGNWGMWEDCQHFHIRNSPPVWRFSCNQASGTPPEGGDAVAEKLNRLLKI